MDNLLNIRGGLLRDGIKGKSAVDFLTPTGPQQSSGLPNLIGIRQAVLQQQMARQGQTPAQQLTALSPSPPRPTRRPSLGDRISGMLPTAGTPEAAGLGAAGQRMLQLSGWSDRPVAMSQILGEAAKAYTTARKETAAEQAAAERQRVADARQAMLDKMAMEKHIAELEKLRAEEGQKALSSAGKYASDLGFVIGTPEHTQAMEEYLAMNAPKGTEVKLPKGPSEYAQKRLLEFAKQTDKATALADNYDFILKTFLANPNLETGPFTQAMLPALQTFAQLGFLNEEQVKNVGSLESLNAAMKQTVPNMRPEGSGSTSNFEFANYTQATNSLSKTTEGNIIIAATRKQAAERKVLEQAERERIFYETDGQKIPTGAELAKIMDDKYGSLFKSPFGQELENKSYDEVSAEFDNMIRSKKIKVGDVVYLGKHLATKDSKGNLVNNTGGFLIVDQAMIQAAQQVEE